MRIEYDRPGRPKSMRDSEERLNSQALASEPVSEPKTPKLRLPRKK